MKFWTAALNIVVIVSLCLLVQPGQCQPAKQRTVPQLKLPTSARTAVDRSYPVRVVQNTLLVMPQADQLKNGSKITWAKPLFMVKAANAVAPPSDTEDDEEDTLSQSIRELGGQVVETIGHGRLTVWVVKFATQEKFLNAESKLTGDKRVQAIQRDYLFHSCDTSTTAVNDPYFASQWYMGALNVLPAWSLSRGGKNVIGVLDSGTNDGVGDLKGKCLSGFDAVFEKLTQSDVQGHGTMVATTAAATADNGVGTAGPATLSDIYPVRVGFANGEVSISAIVKGIYNCGNNGIKILNISSNGRPPFTFAKRRYNNVLHNYLEWFHDQMGGLVFNSAGNSAKYDDSHFRKYLIVVSALNQDFGLASFSTFGDCLWFTAPGTNIVCSDRTDKVVSVNGTSFSSPLTASIAALIWGAKPAMTNLDVERILVETCHKSRGKSWTRWFGFGLPDAEAAMKMTLGK